MLGIGPTLAFYQRKMGRRATTAEPLSSRRTTCTSTPTTAVWIALTKWKDMFQSFGAKWMTKSDLGSQVGAGLGRCRLRVLVAARTGAQGRGGWEPTSQGVTGRAQRGALTPKGPGENEASWIHLSPRHHFLHSCVYHVWST